MSKTIAVIRGDGIGPEIMRATLRVLDELNAGLEYEFVEAGESALAKVGELLPAATLESIARHRVALKSPLTTPIGGGFSSLNVELRKRFDLYANVRPAISFPGTRSRYENIDILTVRENTEGAYLSEGQSLSEDGQTAISMIRNTRRGSERIVRYAFDMAHRLGRNKVTAVHKANIIKTASGLFLDVARSVAKEYPRIEFNEMIVDNACMQLVMRPEQFDVIVTTNLVRRHYFRPVCGPDRRPGARAGGQYRHRGGDFRSGAWLCTGHCRQRHCQPLRSGSGRMSDARSPRVCPNSHCGYARRFAKRWRQRTGLRRISAATAPPKALPMRWSNGFADCSRTSK